MPETGTILVSVVSHGQAELVARLLKDIDTYCKSSPVAVVLTVNVGETLPFSQEDFGFPLEVIHNQFPRGFGANHNAAFRASEGEVFCILNPDVRFSEDPFPPLLEDLSQEQCGIVAPLVLGPLGSAEDSARRFPTPIGILSRALGAKRKLDYAIEREPLPVDWVAGMFMLLPGRVFSELGGFDDRYFLYYEDVDLCFRARLSGYEVLLDPRTAIVHDARRDSHRSFKYLRLHLFSMLRFFVSRSRAIGRR